MVFKRARGAGPSHCLGLSRSFAERVWGSRILGHIGVIWELYGDTGKQHGNYYLGFEVFKSKKFQHVEDGKY